MFKIKVLCLNFCSNQFKISFWANLSFHQSVSWFEILLRKNLDVILKLNFYQTLLCLIVGTPLEGEGTVYSNGFFFVQSILADRYIRRRELRLVSLESLSIVEYTIKMIFYYWFFTRSYRGLIFEKIV